MNHFNPAASYPPHMMPDTLGALPHLATTPIDEHGSQSGSDDGTTYSAYTTVQGTDLDADDDAHSLTSQSLNADGTPKRPMNAFMIFARKRRPQVSAENQSMRTGEISKILSKEWNSMPSAEKQFYLDQAKLLKDNFNNKYPDYVYRRRPNNTRKKRRCDSTSHSADNAASDQGDEVSPLGDCEPSPVEGEPFYGSNASQPRAPMDPTAPFAPNGTYESQYVFPPHDDSFSMPNHRSQFHLNHPRHVSQDSLASRSPLNASHLSQYSFLSGQSDPRSNPYASTHQSHPNAAWDSGPSGRPPPLPSSSQWSGTNNSLERPLSSLDHRSTKFHSQHQHTSYSPTNAQSPNWPGSSPSVSHDGLSHQQNSHQNANNHLFPTLSMPFFPDGQAHNRDHRHHSDSNATTTSGGSNNSNGGSSNRYASNASSGSPHSSSPSLFDPTTSAPGSNSNPLLGSTAASAAMSGNSSNGRPDSRYSNRSFSGSAVSPSSTSASTGPGPGGSGLSNSSCLGSLYASLTQSQHHQDGGGSNRYNGSINGHQRGNPNLTRGQSHPHLSSPSPGPGTNFLHLHQSTHQHVVSPTSATSPSHSDFWAREHQPFR